MGEVTLLLVLFFAFSTTIMALTPHKQHIYITKGSVPDVVNCCNFKKKLTYGSIIFTHFIFLVYSSDMNYHRVYICIHIGKRELLHSGSYQCNA